jgi:TraM recognition site of TraD and TraG
MVRSITQSLNQLERAYGPNHAILDNCHIRIAFSTNDERTAKRVSDALGTATEMRAMKNYAGHRLSPWLGHLMVSRQETSRPLLTPGEVMQLSPNEAIVMVSGVRRVAISDLPSPTRGGRRMRESRTYGVVRGALSNECPYRDRAEIPTAHSSKLVCVIRQANFVVAL